MHRLEFKAALTVTEAGEISGIAWPFGSADRVGDVIEKGAFAFPDTLPMLFGHDQNDVIGVWEVIEETADGLIVKGRMFLDQIARSREVWTMLKEKAVKGLSIGFETLAANPRRGGGRDITKLNLAEISIVAVPAHPGAQIHTIKELPMPLEDENTLTLDTVAERVTTMESDVAAIKDQLGNVEKAATRIETKLARPGAAIETKADPATIERKALAGYIRTGSDIELKAAAATDNGPDGGWFVLPTVDTSIRSLLTDLSPMRGLADVQTIGGSVYERFYSLGKRGAQRVVERDDRPQDTARPELIKVSYGVGEYYAAPAATRHQIEDASVDIAGWLIENATHDFAQTEGEDFLSWDGSNGFARGLLDYGTTNEKDFTRAWGRHQHIAAGHASAPTDANLTASLVKLVAALRKPYKGNARFLMNSNTAVRLRTIVDANGRYLWAPTGNLIEGVEHPLLGYSVEIDENMPDIGADALAMAFGDFKQGYVIVDRHGIRVERDAVTQKGRVLFDTYKRVGGGAGDFNAIKFLKIATA